MTLYIKRRPFITLTLAYIAVLIILNASGCLNRPPKHIDALSIISKSVAVKARVLSQPEYRKNKQLFVIKTYLPDTEKGLKVLVNYKIKAGKITEDIKTGDLINIEGYLRKPHPKTNPGGFDYAKYLSRKNIYLILYAKKIVKTGRRPPPIYKSLALKIRAGMLNSIKKNLPKTEATLLSKMLVGERSRLSETDKTKFINAGVMHILVVSGLHVGYCVAIFWGLFRLLGFSYRRAAMLTIPFIPLYAITTGAYPPVVRASVMALSIIISLSLLRDSDIYQSLSLAAAVILVFSPQSLFTVSFQLSFAATLGILYLYPKFLGIMPVFLRDYPNPYPRLTGRQAGKPSAHGGLFSRLLAGESGIRIRIGSIGIQVGLWILRLFFVSLAAQLAVTPLIAFYFNRISLVGIISNILVVPFVGIIIACGMALCAADLILPWIPLAVLFISKVNYYLLHFLNIVVGFFAGFPGSSIRVTSPSFLFLFCYYFCIWGAFKLKNLPAKYFPKIAYAVSILLIILAANAGLRKYELSNSVDVTFIDVGYGDAVHIRLPNGHNWLIDGGGSYNEKFDVGKRVLLPYFWSKGIKKLNKVVLTSPVFHRYGGLSAVINNFPIDEFIICPEKSTKSSFVKLIEQIETKQIPLKMVQAGLDSGRASRTLRADQAGQKYIVGKATISIISPIVRNKYKSNNSLALALDFYKNRIIFTSDIGWYAQQELVKSGRNIKTTVLQLPKQGKGKLNYRFLRRANPEYIVVSSGKKRHFNPEKLKPAEIYSTNTHGAITISLTKDMINIRGFLQEK